MTPLQSLTRRRVIQLAGAAFSTSAIPGLTREAPALRFGLISDVHHGIRPGVEPRLEAFVEEAKRRKVDFIIQLGDFCYTDGKPETDEFLSIWNRFDGPRYSVLGNHDMDRNDKDAAIAAWGMPGADYSFEAGGFRFIVLDTNHFFKDGRFHHYDAGNWYGAGAEMLGCLLPGQLDWLEAEVAGTHKPVIVFSHYGFDHAWGAGNRREIRDRIFQINQNAGWRKLAACFCGHYHLDGHNIIDRVHYIRVNSASYHWLGSWQGEKWAWYEDPLYSFVTLTHDGRMSIEGRATRFIDGDPYALSFPREVDRDITAAIEDKTLFIETGNA